MPALVAAVPMPMSFMAAFTSSSSESLPAFFMASRRDS